MPGRRLLALLLAPALVAPLTACGDGGPVAPLPVRAPVAATPATTAAVSPSAPPAPATTPAGVGPTVRVPAPAPPPPTPPRPTRGTGTPSPSRPPPDACLGPVRYDVVLAETELALLRSLCFATGGVLRLIGIGPGEVGVDPDDLVSRSYEAGVVDIRFVRAGTVVVTIPQNGTDHRVTVVVV